KPKSAPRNIGLRPRPNLKRESSPRKPERQLTPAPRLQDSQEKRLKENTGKPAPGSARLKGGVNWLRPNCNKRPKRGLWPSAEPHSLKRSSTAASMREGGQGWPGPRPRPKRGKRPKRAPSRSRPGSRLRRG